MFFYVGFCIGNLWAFNEDHRAFNIFRRVIRSSIAAAFIRRAERDTEKEKKRERERYREGEEERERQTERSKYGS